MDSRQYRAKLSYFKIESVSTIPRGSTAEDELQLEVIEVYKMIKCKICNKKFKTPKQLS